MIYEFQGNSIYYIERGEGIPILHLHGFPLDHQSLLGCMEPIFAKIPKKSFRRIYLDYPGMGKSVADTNTGNSDDLLNILCHFIEDIIENVPFILVGSSYGGYLARGIAYRMKSRILGILFICPVIDPDRSHRNVGIHKVLFNDGSLDSALPVAFREEILGSLVRVTAENIRRYEQEYFNIFEKQDSPFIQEFGKIENYKFSFDVDALTSPYSFPVLFLTGKQDSTVGYLDGWALLDKYPRAGYMVLDGAGHSLELDQQKLFSEIAIHWFSQFA
ncbi:MAG: alpha/beta hydrolase [Promethearchaeota archaeon]|nr:MAG: alpha/beta hydrolase [Candidatus Lokiarchaeota archaeon]